MINGLMPFLASPKHASTFSGAARFGDTQLQGLPVVPNGSRRVLVLAKSDGTFGFANDNSDADENMIANALNSVGWRVISVQGLSNWAYQTDYYITVDVMNAFSASQILQQIKQDLNNFAIADVSIITDLTSNDPAGVFGITPKDLTSFANSIEPAIGGIAASVGIGGIAAAALIFGALYLVKK